MKDDQLVQLYLRDHYADRMWSKIMICVIVIVFLGAVASLVTGCGDDAVYAAQHDEQSLDVQEHRSYDACTSNSLDDEVFDWSKCLGEGYAVPDPEKPIHEAPPSVEEVR